MDFSGLKLIVCDMDGTLLNSRLELPDGLFEMIGDLKASGIRFAIASGRSYPTLRRQFESLRDDILFICENGCCIVDHDEPVRVTAFSPDEIRVPVQAALKMPDTYLVFSSLRHAYILRSSGQAVFEEMQKYYAALEIIDSAEEIHEPVIKITVYAPDQAETKAYPYYRDLRGPYAVTLDGTIWINIGPENVSKGTGLSALQQALHIAPAGTMVFGDYLNDYAMMAFSEYSFAMANAHPDLKAVCRYETLSNDEDGVMHVLRQVRDFMQTQDRD